MRPGLLTSFLTGLFVVSAVSAAALAVWYVLSLRQLERTQVTLAAVNRNKLVARSLITDALEYRKKNPAIESVLQAANVVGPALSTNAPAPHPAIK
jgi:hypothetical protein